MPNKLCFYMGKKEHFLIHSSCILGSLKESYCWNFSMCIFVDLIIPFILYSFLFIIINNIFLNILIHCFFNKKENIWVDIIKLFLLMNFHWENVNLSCFLWNEFSNYIKQIFHLCGINCNALSPLIIYLFEMSISFLF